jgi:SAM-dependent methyltransferase
MARGNQQGTGQKGHWDNTYTGNPTFFGAGPSEFAYTALGLFKGAGVGSVLELGCGQGRDSLLFAREGFHVTALDYAEAGLLKLQGSAREIGVSDRIDTRPFDVRKSLPFPDGSFDACYSHMLLCMELSTEELRGILGEIRRILKPDGLALYSVRNTVDKHFGTGVHKSEDMYDIDGFVVHFFSEEKIRSLVTGYELIDLRRMQEGSLPRELFGVVLRKREKAANTSHMQKEEEMDVADHMGKFQDFFHAVFNIGVLDKKTKHLVALGASLAAACDS